VNPVRSHWIRRAALLFAASPIVAGAVALSTGIDFVTAIVLTLYMWALVSFILALIALAALLGRAIVRGARALRR
jgi:hypothetical protein